MSDKKQSSVDWLSEQTFNAFNLMQQGYITMAEFRFKMLNYEQEAKAMHKEEIIHSHLLGLIHPLEKEATEQAEDYYSETFNR